MQRLVVSPQSDVLWKEDAEGYAKTGKPFDVTDIKSDADRLFLKGLAEKYGYTLNRDEQGRYTFRKPNWDTTPGDQASQRR